MPRRPGHRRDAGFAVTTAGAATASVPSAPTNVTATAHAASAKVSWTAPSTNGTPITSYTVTSSPTAKTCTTTGTTDCTVTGLANGDKYTFKVHAHNGKGTGPTSTPSNTVIPTSVPGKPTGISVTSENAAVKIAWTAPADNGTSITKYTATGTPGGKSCTTTGALTCTVSHLTNGTPYTYKVHATNGRGTGPTSTPSASVVPASPPTTEPTLTGTSSGNGSITLDWKPVTPGKDGGATITGYVTHAEIGTTVKATTNVAATATTATVSGLVNGTAYRVTVAAVNSAGDGPPATSGEITPAGPPTKPVKVVAEAADGAVLIIWTAPSAAGTAITGYKVTVLTSTKTCTTKTALTCYVTTLTNGTPYSFTVHATNGRGTGPTSTPTTPVTPGFVPSAPLDVRAAPTDASATVNWTPPSTDGGSSITGYTATSFPTTRTCTTSGALTCKVSGLKNGTMYTFRVRATNDVGIGPSSSPSTGVKPSTVPDAPVDVTATSSNGSASVSWEIVATGTNGSTITGYTATSTPTQRSCTTTSASAKSCTVNNLVNGTSYSFTVTAKNADGTSPPSAPSSHVTPARRPTKGPTFKSVTTHNTVLTAQWYKLPTAEDGGNPVKSYTFTVTGTLLTATKKKYKVSQTILTTGTTPITTTVSDVPYGVPLTVTVAAVNTFGTGPTTTWGSSLVAKTVPTPPLYVHATTAYESAEVTWFDPLDIYGTPTPQLVNEADNGTPIVGYKVTSSPTTHTCTTTTFMSNVCYVPGLVNGRHYTFTVRAINGQGASTPSTPSNTIVPATVPSAPAPVTASPHNASATVSWGASATDHGSPIIKYIVTSGRTTETCTSVTLTCRVTGLPNGQADSFRARAQNANGDGPRSYSSNLVTPFTVPSQPTTLIAHPGNAKVTVQWKKPATNGSPITGYTVTSTPTGHTCTSNSTSSTASCSVGGLANGTSYQFTVRATNKAGTGLTSAPVTAVPFSAPVNPPTLSHWSSGDESITVTWSPLPAATDGGRAVTKYLVKAQIGTSVKRTLTVTVPATTATVTGLVNGTSYMVTWRQSTQVATGPGAPRRRSRRRRCPVRR